MTKKIGIVGWKTGENSFGVTIPYFTFFQQYGDVTILSPGEYNPNIDLLVLPGGLDVSPIRYSKVPSLNTSSPNILLEYFDQHILPMYIANKTKIFGICRGLQTLNVHFGGDLTQHVEHVYSNPRNERVHKIIANPNIAKHFNFIKLNDKIKVNSMHHQVICRLGETLIPLFYSEEGFVEVIANQDFNIVAVQYHPEEIYDRLSDTLIKHLL